MSGDLSGPGISREEVDQLAKQVLALAPMTSGRADELLASWRARLDEDEATANAGARRAGMPWRAEPQPGTPGGLVFDDLGLVGSTGGRYAADHIARYDPARAVREIPEKRLVLAEHLPVESIYGLACGRCVSWQDAPLAEGGETEFGIAIPDPWPCVPVRSVAASWEGAIPAAPGIG